MKLLQTLVEIFDFNAPGEWIQHDDLHVKQFEVGGESYEIWAQQDQIDGECVVRVRFAHLQDGKTSLDLTNLNNGSGKVLATVMNSTWERFDAADVFVFSSEDDPDRTRTYSKIAAHLSMSHNLRLETADYAGGGKIFTLTKQSSVLRLGGFV